MDLTPKQQTTELIRQAQNILIVTGREPNNDQLASAVGLHSVLTKLGKVSHVVITDRLPKIASVLDTSVVSTDMQGVRDFIVSVDMRKAQVDKVRYDVVGENSERLDITITPHGGNFDAKDVSFGYGAYQFDLVIALGVPSISKLDRLHEANPTIFDGLHLINIDYHRINENFGSVNLVDTTATCVAEILISTIESLGQGMIDAPIATAFLASFMSNTANFTAPATTAKALTIAAQMMSAGAKQQEIVKVLAASVRNPEPAKVYSKPKAEEKPVEAKVEREREVEAKPGVAVEPESRQESSSEPKVRKTAESSDDTAEQEGSKKNSMNSKKDKQPSPSSQASTSDHGQDASKAPAEADSPSELKSPLELS